MDSLPQHRAGRRRDGQRRGRSGEGTGRVETRTRRRAGRAAETGLSGAVAKHTPLCTSGRRAAAASARPAPPGPPAVAAALRAKCLRGQHGPAVVCRHS